MAVATTYAVLRKLMADVDVPAWRELLSRAAWMHESACTDPSLAGVNLFPGVGDPTRPAKAACARCVVRERCLEFALQHCEVDDVWGWDERAPTARHSEGTAQVARGLAVASESSSLAALSQSGSPAG